MTVARRMVEVAVRVYNAAYIHAGDTLRERADVFIRHAGIYHYRLFITHEQIGIAPFTAYHERLLS
jgi:hypothetical protein